MHMLSHPSNGRAAMGGMDANGSVTLMLLRFTCESGHLNRISTVLGQYWTSLHSIPLALFLTSLDQSGEPFSFLLESTNIYYASNSGSDNTGIYLAGWEDNI